MGSISVSMSTYDGTGTSGNDLDDKVQQILDGEHVDFNVDVPWH